MKTRLTIKNKQNEVLQFAIFEDQQTMDDFIEMLATTHPYGKPEHQVEVSPEVRNEQGEIVTGAIYETIPAEYVVEIEDITAQVNQAEINEAALRYLAETDYLVIRSIDDPSKPVSDEVKALRQAARDSIVK